MTGETDGNITILGNLNILLLSMERLSRCKINRAREIINNKIETSNFIDISRTLHMKKSEYTLFSSAHRIFSRIDYTGAQN